MQINLSTYLPFMAVNGAHKKMGRQRKRVVFLIHSAELYGVLEGVANEFLNDPVRFECIFVALPKDYSAKSTNFTGEDEVYHFLENKGLNPLLMKGKNHADLLYLMHLAPDYIFRQSPWDHHLPEPFRTPNLSFSKLCYVTYGMMLSGTGNSQYNQPFHNFCDFIFSETDFHQAEYKNRRQLGDLGVHLTGTPRLESYYKRVQDLPSGRWPIDVPKNTPKVMWAPHHCFDSKWIGASTFFDHYQTMLDYAKRDDISILFRPHPAMREKVVVSGKMTGVEYDCWLHEFESGPYSRLDRESEYIDQMQASDFMITDGISFFVEYLVTGKPLIRTRSPNAKPLNEFGEWLLQKYRQVSSQKELLHILDEISHFKYVDLELEGRKELTNLFEEINHGASRKIFQIIENDAFGMTNVSSENVLTNLNEIQS
jgi:hypothetical protein